MLWRKAVFIILVVFCLSPFGSAPTALALGIGLALTIGSPFPQLFGRPTDLIFYVSVIFLGLDTDLGNVYQTVKRAGLLLIVATAFSWYLDVKAVSTDNFLSIFADAGSKESESPRVGYAASSNGRYLIFSILLLFAAPLLGAWFHVTPLQFSTWSAIAFPISSAAIAAPLAVSTEAVNAGVALVLVRIVLVFLLGLIVPHSGSEKTESRLPWFVLLYLAAVTFRTYSPPAIFPSIYDSLVNLGRAGILLTLFFIGSSASIASFKAVRISVIAQMFVWLAAAAVLIWTISRLL